MQQLKVIGEMILQITFSWISQTSCISVPVTHTEAQNYFSQGSDRVTVRVMLGRDRWWQTDKVTLRQRMRAFQTELSYSDEIWSLIHTRTHTKRHNNIGNKISVHNFTNTRHITLSQCSYTCTVAVLSVPVTLVLQVCGRHRKVYGPGCLCLPAKHKQGQ